MPRTIFRQLLNISKETSEPLCAICSTAWSSSQWKCVFWCSYRNSCFWVSPHCLQSGYWAPLQRTCFYPEVFVHSDIIPPDPSLLHAEASQHIYPLLFGEVFLASFVAFNRLSLVVPYLSYTGEPKIGQRASCLVSPVLSQDRAVICFIFASPSHHVVYTQ